MMRLLAFVIGFLPAIVCSQDPKVELMQEHQTESTRVRIKQDQELVAPTVNPTDKQEMERRQADQRLEQQRLQESQRSRQQQLGQAVKLLPPEQVGATPQLQLRRFEFERDSQQLQFDIQNQQRRFSDELTKPKR